MKFPFLAEDAPPEQLVSPVNMSQCMFAVLQSGKATYLDLQEKLSARDMYNILEAISVQNYNERVWNKHLERR